MRKCERLALFLVFSIVLLALTISALKTESSSYNQSVTISDGGSTNISSDSYQQGVIVGEIGGETSSTSYDTHLGFFYGVSGFVPSIVLNKPLNDSFLTVSYALLNATVTDADNQPLDIYVWGANSTLQLNAGNHSLLYVLKNVPNTNAGINITYNWTAPIVQPDSDNSTKLLFHFDNRSKFGETTEGLDNTTYDFSGNANNGTFYGGATINFTDSKFGGAAEFDGVDDYIELNTSLLSSINSSGTLSFWYYPKTETGSPFTISDGSGWADEHLALYGRVGQYILKLSFADDTNTINEIQVDPSMSLNTWAYLTVTWTLTTYKTYKNGDLVSSGSKTIVPAISGNTWIGKQQGLWGNFKGTIDEVAIWNRSLSATEILDLYQLKSSKYYWKVNVTDSSKKTSESETWEFTIDATKPRINSSINNSAPKRWEVVNISANVSDEYALNFCQFIINQSDGDKEYFNQTLTGTDAQCSQNFTIALPRDSVINFTAIVYDTANNTNQSEHITTVANTPPPKVILRFPATNNYTINRTPTFGWYNVTDVDNDSLLFNIFIQCVDCSSDNRNVNVTALNYTPSELLFLGDDNYYYNWSVRAIDNSSSGVTSFGQFSDEWNITINSYVSLSLLANEVDFGTLALGQNDNTTDDSPGPIVMDNDGNVNENVSIYAEDDLWESVANPTDKFQFKIGNTTEKDSFNWSESITDFTNLPTSAVVAVNSLDYHDTSDSAEADIRVDVPTDEPLGTRQSKIVFEARKS